MDRLGKHVREKPGLQDDRDANVFDTDKAHDFTINAEFLSI